MLQMTRELTATYKTHSQSAYLMFLSNFILVVLWSAAMRPINQQYDSWYLRRLKYVSKLSDNLKQLDTCNLHPNLKKGIQDLIQFVQNDLSQIPKDFIIKKVDELSRDYFSLFDRNWSHLPEEDEKNLDDLPKPEKILISVGHHIGIGDELIFSYLVAGIREKYPTAEIELWSHSADLWNWNTNIKSQQVGDDILEPFHRARTLLAEDEGALIIFCDFLSDKIYRILESVEEYKRFVYIDLGARLARIINHNKNYIFEYNSNDLSLTIYDSLERILNEIGVKAVTKTPIVQKTLKSIPEHSKPTLFLNPHSSKEQPAATAGWWVGLIQQLNEYRAIKVQISQGLNEENYEFASIIHQELRQLKIEVQVLERIGLSSILRKMSQADIVVGLDTFTAHINTLYSCRCVTVFFGPSGRAWRVPTPSVLNASLSDPVQYAAALAWLLLSPPIDEYVSDTLSVIFFSTSEIYSQLADNIVSPDLIGKFHFMLKETTSLFNSGLLTQEVFHGFRLEDLTLMIQKLSAAEWGKPLPKAMQTSLLMAFREFISTNFFRYAAYRTTQRTDLNQLNESLVNAG